MHKVIVERARPGSGYNNPKGDPYKHVDLEDQPLKESMKVRHMDRRHFNENLNPLRRWLESKVGQPWDKVYSEACKVIKPNSTVKNHIKVHLLDMVVQDAVLIDGVPCQVVRWGNGYTEIGHSSWNTLYVHPVSKLLLSHKPKKFVPPVKEVTKIALKSNKSKPSGIVLPFGMGFVTDQKYNEVLEKIHGIWYFAKTITGVTTHYTTGTGRWVPRSYQKDFEHTYFKRQLNKKELKQHKLTNDKA